MAEGLQVEQVKEKGKAGLKSLHCRYGWYGGHEKCPGHVLIGVGVNQTRVKCACDCHGA